MSMWAFLTGHIAHAGTLASQTFTSGHDSSSSDFSGLSAASIQRRRVLKKRRTEEGGQEEPASQAAAATSDVIASLLDRAQSLSQPQGPPAPYGGEIEAWTKILGYKLANVHPDDLEDTCIELLGVIQRQVAKRKVPQPAAQPPPQLPPPTRRPSTPAAFGPWMPAPPRPVTPATPTYQVPYPMPSTSGYQTAYVPPPSAPAPQPVVFTQSTAVATSAVSTPSSTVSSPSTAFLQHLVTLSPLTPTMTTLESYTNNSSIASSTLNTPQGPDEADL